MSLFAAMLVTTALLTPVYWLARGAKVTEMRVSSYFNNFGRKL